MKTLKTLILLILGLCSAATVSAADYYVRGVARCILDDGSGNFPISDAGEVFVSTTPSATPQWTAGEYVSNTISGPLSGSASVTFHFWARAKAGYTFVGWGTTKASKTASSGTAGLEGQPWASKTTLWSGKSEAAPNELVRYAIFRKNAEEDLSGGGVAMLSTDGTTHTENSTLNEWPVKIYFAEPLAYRDYSGYTEGYGVNTSLISSITCTHRATGKKSTIMTARVSGTIDAKGSDAYGIVYFPADLVTGTYDVHLPKGLFNTKSGNVTAACNFVLTVNADNTPFNIVSKSPTEGFSWNAGPDTNNEVSDGETVLVALTFNKFVASCAATDPGITLTNTTNGCEHLHRGYSISKINQKVGIIDLGGLPDGDYTFVLPANVFFDSSGRGNAALELHFSVSNSTYAAWTLPTYTQVTPSIGNNSTVSALNTIEFTMERAPYAAPTGLMGNPKVSALKVSEKYTPGVDYSDPDNRPELVTENISGVSLEVVNGKLVVRFTDVFLSESKVVISIPAGAVINVPRSSTMTAEQLYKAGGCTNPSIQMTFNVLPGTTGIEGIEFDNEAANTQALPSAAESASAAIYSVSGQRTTRLQPGVNIIRTAKGARKVIK